MSPLLGGEARVTVFVYVLWIQTIYINVDLPHLRLNIFSSKDGA